MNRAYGLKFERWQSKGTLVASEGQLKVFDWVVFFVVAVFCYLAYVHQDILNTGGSSISYLKGHFLDFYDYNLEHKVEEMNNYMPSTYFLFAIWNIPIYLLRIISVSTSKVSIIAAMWFKLLPVLFFLACGFLIYRIGLTIGFGNKKSNIMCYCFLTSPLAFFSPLIFGQYDSFNVFFVLAGLYFYFRDDFARFVLFFGIALTFKYFAAFIFFPLLFLKEKRISKLLKYSFFVWVPFLVECLPYIFTSNAFRRGVLGFRVAGYVTGSGFKLLNGVATISVVVVLWVVLVAWAYFKDVGDNFEDFVKWAMFFCCVVVFLIFGLSMWHPQWLIFGAVFLTISSMISEKAYLFFVLDVFLFFCFFVFTLFTMAEVSENLLVKGVFSGLTNEFGPALTLKSLIPIDSEAARTLFYSLFSGLFLVNAVFKHPKFAAKSLDASVSNCLNVIRLRFASVGFIWILPTMVCLIVSSSMPFYVTKSSGNLNPNPEPIVKEKILKQQFFSSMSYKVEEFRGLFVKTGGAEDLAVNLSLVDSKTSEVLYSKDYCSDNFKLGEVSVLKVDEPVFLKKGRVYFVSLSSSCGDFKDAFSIFKVSTPLFNVTNENNHAIIDEAAVDENLCLDVLGFAVHDSL